MLRHHLALLVVAAAPLSACAGTPASPFDQLKTAQVTAFRLQNYEPPPQVAPAAQPPQGPQVIPGLPAELQRWVQAGASMLPPGLLPPGLLPGALGQPQVVPQVTPQQDMTPRFHGFRILGQVPVADAALRQEIGDILGFERSFDQTSAPCGFAEFGYSIANGFNRPPVDVLVSLSCEKVIATNFAWPHKVSGLTPDSVKRLATLSGRIFGGG